jgi:AraC-like DNA-binding protein
MDIVYIIGSAQAIFFSVLLFKVNSKKVHEIILPLWLLLLGLHLVVLFFLNPDAFKINNFFAILHFTLPLIHWPLLYLYLDSLIKNNEKIRIDKLLVFAPFFIFILLNILFTDVTIQAKDFYFRTLAKPSGLIHINLIVNIIYGFICLVLCLIQLRKFNKKIKNHFSNTDKVNLKWLAHLIFGFSSILLVSLCYILSVRVFHLKTHYNIDFFIYGTISIFIFFIGFYSLKRTNLLNNIIPQIADDSSDCDSQQSENIIKNKYEIYGLKKDAAIELKNNLLRLMSEKKYYLNPELSLSQLAEELGIYKHYLTQVLNDELHLNFYDFVNNYRVEEIKELMRNPKYNHFTIFAIALEAGFNSKSAFNRIFKKATGLTPSQYKRQYQH